LQSFSYPFHDPVLTDRAFIASPKLLEKLLWASYWEVYVLCFSIIGLRQGMTGDAALSRKSIWCSDFIGYKFYNDHFCSLYT
jgi:hypothetical protein